MNTVACLKRTVRSQVLMDAIELVVLTMGLWFEQAGLSNFGKAKLKKIFYVF